MDHDQAFKNLILDYPVAALEFFASVSGLAGATITPVREEQLQEVLGSRYRKLDVPLKVEWPDGRRAGVLFVVEEETDPRRFSIHRLAHYCLDLADMLKTTQVVPVVVFLKMGEFPHELLLGDGMGIYLSFRFICCELARLPAQQYLDSRNIVARLNLPNMRHNQEQRVEVYAHALDGLASLETDWNQQRKYIDFIDAYADLSEDEMARYNAEYTDTTGGKAMGFLNAIIDEKLLEGERKGWRKGLQDGRQEGRQEGEAALLLRLMALRFGPLDEALRERVRAADAETLLQWGERILTAATAEDVVKA
jgi:hypothetical protein